MTAAGCPPLPGINFRKPGTDCSRVFDRVRELVDTGRYERVIFASWWDQYFTGMFCIWQDKRCQAKISDVKEAAQIFNVVVSTWREWRARGVAVSVILPEPAPGFDQPVELARRRYLGLDAAPAESISTNDYARAAGPVRGVLVLAAKLTGASVIDPADQLCHDDRCWFIDDRKQPILRDSNHFRATWAAQHMHYPDVLLSESSGGEQIGKHDSGSWRMN